MSAQTVIDSLEFARTEQTLRGSLPIPGLARLKDSLHDTAGQVEFVVRGGSDARRRPILTIDITGTLHLQCQRCLGALEYPLRLTNTLLLVSRAEAESEEPDDAEVERIEAGAELDVASVIEDEIILSLPYAPRHDEGRCGEGLSTVPDDARVSAFTKLAALKKDSH